MSRVVRLAARRASGYTGKCEATLEAIRACEQPEALADQVVTGHGIDGVDALDACHRAAKTIHEFFHILDRQQHVLRGAERAPPLSSLFAAGGAMHVHKAGAVLEGDAIDAWCDRMHAGWGAAATLHTEANIVMERPEPGVVRSRSYWTALVDGAVTAYGTHVDELVAVDGVVNGVLLERAEWRFRRREIRHLFAAS